MTAIPNLNQTDGSLDTLTENQDLIGLDRNNAKCNQEVAMSNNEAANQLAQQYYNKASGCSVRAQEDNLFDYKSWREN